MYWPAFYPKETHKENQKEKKSLQFLSAFRMQINELSEIEFYVLISQTKYTAHRIGLDIFPPLSLFKVLWQELVLE